MKKLSNKQVANELKKALELPYKNPRGQVFDKYGTGSNACLYSDGNGQHCIAGHVCKQLGILPEDTSEFENARFYRTPMADSMLGESIEALNFAQSCADSNIKWQDIEDQRVMGFIELYYEGEES